MNDLTDEHTDPFSEEESSDDERSDIGGNDEADDADDSSRLQSPSRISKQSTTNGMEHEQSLEYSIRRLSQS